METIETFFGYQIAKRQPTDADFTVCVMDEEDDFKPQQSFDTYEEAYRFVQAEMAKDQEIADLLKRLAPSCIDVTRR